MQSSHIFKRAGTYFNLDNPEDSYRIAMTTRDIIRNYMAFTDEEMETIALNINDPSNGIGFERNCHISFDSFKFSLIATEVPNEYTIQLHGPKSRRVFPFPPTGGHEHRVVFKDYSDSDPPIPLPNPAYLRLHAAIAGILNMSGAGEVMDEFEYKHGKIGSNLLAKSDYNFETFLSWIDLNSKLFPVHQ
ncbi:hypothetical protein IW262DRAFT_263539 [Armillaria fumosa]|nr:hypothetical protein IW262DRAFT_263539 [Armillaria fumosa]